MAHLLEIDSGIIGIHKALMVCDRIYCELIGENRADVIEKYLTPKQEKIMKSMRKFISVIRTEYALALLNEKDKAKAELIKSSFEKRAKSYPYLSDAVAEKELIATAQAKAENSPM